MANRKKTDHEKLAFRLAEILRRWNEGEALGVKQLAEEYKVAARTIERDLIRFAFVPYSKVDGKYSLDSSYLGKFNFQNIQTFAAIAGVSDLFPHLDRNVLRQLVDNQANVAYASKGYFFENKDSLKSSLPLFESAIKARHSVSFTYKNNRRKVEPYKLVHYHNCWYLAAVHDGALKTYRISRMESMQLHSDLPSFQPNAEIVKLVESSEDIWFGEETEEVILKADPMIASHFHSRQLLPSQQIVRKLDDGGLLLSSRMVNSLHILPLIRFWIPHLHIVTPVSLKTELEEELKRFLGD